MRGAPNAGVNEWDGVLADIRAITRSDRHHIAPLKTVVKRTAEGYVPSAAS
jgi:hypothetical protein